LLVVDPCTDISLPLPGRSVGKVRVAYSLPQNERLFITTDRLSAFDQIVAAVPYKGQVLNQLAAWWFANTTDIIGNHIVSLPDQNATIAQGATPLPVEVVVRGVMTGSTSTSIWKQYEQGKREIYGYSFADGITKNTLLPEAIITPTTKGDTGAHDEPLTNSEVVDRGLVDAATWATVQKAALSLFARGQQIAQRAGLLLADTKYEFGTLPHGEVIIIDEMHTPDSSRFWEISDALGYRGNGTPPVLDEVVIATTTRRYIAAYERITGTAFVPGEYPIQQRLILALQKANIL